MQFRTDVRNERSRRAIAGIGAAYEGTLRCYERRLDGTLRYSAMYAVTAARWPDVRELLEKRLNACSGKRIDGAAPWGNERFDFVAVGAGPANLSLAALAKPHEDLRFRAMERRTRPDWHPGLMVPGAALVPGEDGLRVSFLHPQWRSQPVPSGAHEAPAFTADDLAAGRDALAVRAPLLAEQADGGRVFWDTHPPDGRKRCFLRPEAAIGGPS